MIQFPHFSLLLNKTVKTHHRIVYLCSWSYQCKRILYIKTITRCALLAKWYLFIYVVIPINRLRENLILENFYSKHSSICFHIYNKRFVHTDYFNIHSDVVSVSCFGVRFSVMFHLMFVHYTFSSVWVAEWPPFGK